MGSVGDCFDNAMAESFFASLECELLAKHPFKTQAEARIAIFEYLEGFYNPHRLHSSLGYVSPVNYERRYSTHPYASLESRGNKKQGRNSRCALRKLSIVNTRPQCLCM